VIGALTALLRSPAPSFEQILGSVFSTTFMASMITIPVVLVLVLPTFLIARRGQWATLRVATVSGACTGILLLAVVSDAHPSAVILGAVVGAATGAAFLSIAGATAKSPTS
jgi:hypothetical protein